jgi:hypothetical protein
MFRFTIRDVLWLTVVVALTIMWQADRKRAVRFEESHRQLSERFRQAETQLADYEAKLQDERAWEASRRDPKSLLHFPLPSKAGTTLSERANEAIRRIESIQVK